MCNQGRDTRGVITYNHPRVKIDNSSTLEIYSTTILQSVKERNDIRYLIPPKVWGYFMNKFYEKNLNHSAFE